jgi:hypothetical protein
MRKQQLMIQKVDEILSLKSKMKKRTFGVIFCQKDF